MSLFKEGGPHRVRQTGAEQFHLSINLPVDEFGMIGRECPSSSCAPGYFKVKPGTGITGGQSLAYCPYCRTSADPGAFHTEAQAEYARQIAINEAIGGVNDMVRGALRLDSRGKRRIGGGLLSIEMSLEPARPRPVGRPAEEELRRDLKCPSCGFEHAVFGLAVWCPDCGTDLFLDHVRAELEVLRQVLAAVPERRTKLGARVAARDIENTLEDAVSIFETVLKVIGRLHLQALARSDDEISRHLETKIRNRFQNVASATDAFRELLGQELFGAEEETDRKALADTFEKRHPITHNLGIIDRKYIERAESGQLLGREVRVSADEVLACLVIVERVLTHAYAQRAPRPRDPGAAL